MKQIIILAVILMAGTVLAGDPNSMPNPTAWNRVTVERNGNYTTIKLWTPEANQRALISGTLSIPPFPKLVENVIFRHIDKWIKDLFDVLNSDLTDNLLETEAARLKREAARIR